MKINRQQVGIINEAVDDVFQRLKARLLGRFFTGPHIYFEVAKEDPMDSIESLYRYASHMLHGPGHAISDDSLRDLAEVTGNYLDAAKLKVINNVLAGVRAAETPDDAFKALEAGIEKAHSVAQNLITSESRIAQSYAERDGIQRLASGMGIEDPLVAFLGRYDQKTCKYCLKMYHMPGNPAEPRVYRMSELTSGYFRGKDWDGTTPYFAPLHPHCRHVMTFVPPNYGFTAAGKIKFVGFGFDARSDQDLRKHEEHPPELLAKHEECHDCLAQGLDF